MKIQRRKRLYIFPQAQSKLLLRVAAYWASCCFFVILPVLLGQLYADPSRLFFEHVPDLWRQYSHVALPFILVLPLALLDMLRYSNRLLGPLFRMRRVMNALAAGQDVDHISFRERDEWRELADSFNLIADELREVRRLAPRPSKQTEMDDEREPLGLSST